MTIKPQDREVLEALGSIGGEGSAAELREVLGFECGRNLKRLEMKGMVRKVRRVDNSRLWRWGLC